MAKNAKPLSERELDEGLQALEGWRVEEGELRRQFKFRNFSEAIAWMVRVAIEAERLDHHPDWSNSWNKVDVRLRTHSIDALSELDLKLAEKMNDFA